MDCSLATRTLPRTVPARDTVQGWDSNPSPNRRGAGHSASVLDPSSPAFPIAPIDACIDLERGVSDARSANREAASTPGTGSSRARMLHWLPAGRITPASRSPPCTVWLKTNASSTEPAAHRIHADSARCALSRFATETGPGVAAAITRQPPRAAQRPHASLQARHRAGPARHAAPAVPSPAAATATRSPAVRPRARR